MSILTSIHKRMAPKTAWHHCLVWQALSIIYMLTYIYIIHIQNAHWHPVFYTFYESYPTTCLCLPWDWNPITALLRTSLRGLKNTDSACLLQNKFCCNFWGWCKTLAAVQNNKQYIFYNGSTKIASNISFLGLLVLLFCLRSQEKKSTACFECLPFNVCYVLIYLSNLFFLFCPLQPCDCTKGFSMPTLHGGFPGIFYLFQLFKCLSSPGVKGEELDSLRVMQCFCMAFQ